MFFNLMNSSEKFSEESLIQLKELICKYPFFHGARVLYLQNLKSLGSPILNSEIQSQASILPNRQHLFVKLNPPKPSVSIATEVNVVAEPEVEVKPKARSRKKPSVSEPSFTLLEGTNHADAKTINAEASPNSTDTEILELIEGNVENGIVNIDSSKNGEATVSLIDVFLNSNPKIERPAMPARGEVVENEDISLSSVVEPEEVASEPLAQIFVMQGYFDKAIGVYEKLSLKYPEKSSYFADQIRKIKEQIK